MLVPGLNSKLWAEQKLPESQGVGEWDGRRLQPLRLGISSLWLEEERQQTLAQPQASLPPPITSLD